MTPLALTLAFLGIDPTVAITAVVVIAGTAFMAFMVYLTTEDDYLEGETGLEPADD